jgi:hypothetical protein
VFGAVMVLNRVQVAAPMAWDVHVFAGQRGDQFSR